MVSLPQRTPSTTSTPPPPPPPAAGTPTPRAGGSARASDPRARGYPEGMFSTPTRRMVPVVVIPTSEPRADEVSGVSDGSSALSSLAPSTAGPSPGQFTAAQKRKRINESASPLSRMYKPSSDGSDDAADVEGQLDSAEAGEETVRDEADARISHSPKRAKQEQDQQPGDQKEATTDSDDELPDILPSVRPAEAVRVQPKRTATDTSRAGTPSRVPRTVMPLPVPRPPVKSLKTTAGTNLSIAAMLKRKKEQASKGTDMDGVREADELVRETEKREAMEAARQARIMAAERERREVEAMQKELDQSFLSPVKKKGGLAGAGVATPANVTEAAGQAAKGPIKSSPASSRTPITLKPDGGWASDGLDDEDDFSSDEDADAEEEGVRTEHSKDDAARGPQKSKLLSEMSKTLEGVELTSGKDALVNIIASDHGHIQDPGGSKRRRCTDTVGGRSLSSSIWSPGRVVLCRVHRPPINVHFRPLGRMMGHAMRAGPVALSTMLQHMSASSAPLALTAGELAYLMSVAVHGLDSYSSDGPKDPLAGIKVGPSTEAARRISWRTARAERQAVGSATCAVIASFCRSPRTTSSFDDKERADIDVAARQWLMEVLAGLGASPNELKRLPPGCHYMSGSWSPPRVRRRDRRQLLSGAEEGAAEGTDKHGGKDAKSQTGSARSSALLPHIGWLSLEERAEAVGRLCRVIQALSSTALVCWYTRYCFCVALALLSASHADDGLNQELGIAMTAVLTGDQTTPSNDQQRYLADAATKVHDAFRTWSKVSFAKMLRNLPKSNTSLREFARLVAWLALQHEHGLLNAPGRLRHSDSVQKKDDSQAQLGSSKIDFAVLQDLIVTNVPSSPFWISTTADDQRKAAIEAAAATTALGADSKPSPKKSVRVTNYTEVAAWTEIVNVALIDVAIQATNFDIPSSDASTATPGAAVPNKLGRQAKAALILATRPWTAKLAASTGLTTNDPGAVVEPPLPQADFERVRALNGIRDALRALSNKIVDYRGSNLDRSLAKDALQRAQIRLRYLLPFYFADGRMSNQLKMPEIYGKQLADDGREEPAIASDSELSA